MANYTRPRPRCQQEFSRGAPRRFPAGFNCGMTVYWIICEIGAKTVALLFCTRLLYYYSKAAKIKRKDGTEGA
jgi:hypothetical protein